MDRTHNNPSTSSVLPNSWVQEVSGSVGVDGVSEEVARCIASDVEFRMRLLIQEAAKFSRHSKRPTATLGVSDVNLALESLNLPPVLGYSGGSKPTYKVLEVGDEDNGRGNHVLKADPVVSLEGVASAALPPISLAPTLHAHWMAVSGQPAHIRENPSKKEAARRITGLKDGGGVGGVAAACGVGEPAEVVVVPRSLHSLSKEQQSMLSHITKTITDKKFGTQLQKDVVDAIRKDTALVPILPYLSKLLTDVVSEAVVASVDAVDSVKRAKMAVGGEAAASAAYAKAVSLVLEEGSRHVSKLRSIIAIWRGVFQNKVLESADVLHQVIPQLLSVAVVHSLAPGDPTDSFPARVDAALCLGDLLVRHGRNHPITIRRIVGSLRNVLFSGRRPLTSHYGALSALGALGPLAVEGVLMPHVGMYGSILARVLEPARENPQARKQIRLTVGAFWGAVAVWACGGEVSSSGEGGEDGESTFEGEPLYKDACSLEPATGELDDSELLTPELLHPSVMQSADLEEAESAERIAGISSGSYFADLDAVFGEDQIPRMVALGFSQNL